MTRRLRNIFTFIGILVGLSVISNIILLLWGVHQHRELQSDYVGSMRAVTQDLRLADVSLNDHKEVSGTPDYLISMAAGVLFHVQQTPYGKGYEFTVANALATTEYMITHPQDTTSTQLASAKEFVHSADQILRTSVAMNGTVDIGKVQQAIKQISQDIPNSVKNFR